MTKFAGLVGYVTQEETVPGVWSPVPNPKMMKGDTLRLSSTNGNGARISDSGKANDDITLSHRVSLIGDAYAFDNYFNIAWVEVRGRKWEVTTVEIQRPRIIVTLGGLWNG